jgi:hypothetical protein
MLEIQYEVNDEVSNPEWCTWDEWEPLSTEVSLSRAYEDDMLPGGLSPVTVIRRLMGMVVGMINTHRICFFYFNPSTDRKRRFYQQILPHFLAALEGNWQAQEVEGKWFYITRDAVS